MSHTLFQDKQASRLLSRVSDDVSQLRQDIRRLFKHTTHNTLPHGAKEIAESAKHRLAAGGAYAASQLRSLTCSRSGRCSSTALIGGALIVGALAAGAYLCFKNREAEELEEEAENE